MPSLLQFSANCPLISNEAQLTRQVGSGPRQTTKPCQQRSQMGAVFLSNRGEFQPHSASALHMAHHSLGFDLPFFDEKIDLCLGPYRLRFMSRNKNSPKAQIPDARNITMLDATPIHPNPSGVSTREVFLRE